MAGALKAILGGIGGALQGMQTNTTGDNKNSFSQGLSDLGDKIGEKIKEKKEVSTDTAAATGNSTISDEDLKNIYGETIDDKIIENFAKISAIDFKYNQEAQNEYQNELNVDDKEHIGVIAQELENNEATKGTVEHTENGDLAVNTDQLTMADTAAIAELSRRVLALEQAVKELANK